MAAAREEAPENAAELLVKALEQLMQIKQRWYMLDAFQSELDDANRGRSMWFNNDNIWRIMLDSRDTAVVVLLDWLVATSHQRHGLFAKLQECRGSFSAGVGRDDGLAAAHRRDALARCFGRVAGDTPTKADIEPFARDSTCSRTSTAGRTTATSIGPTSSSRGGRRNRLRRCSALPRWEPFFADVEQILSDLLLVANGSGFSIGSHARINFGNGEGPPWTSSCLRPRRGTRRFRGSTLR